MVMIQKYSFNSSLIARFKLQNEKKACLNT